jgi:hypothetical protein
MFTHPCRFLPQPFRSQTILSILFLISLAGSGCSLGTLTALSRAKDKKAQTTNNGADAALPVLPDLHADAATDLRAYDKYAAQIRAYLDQESFDQIDVIADAVRSDKSRFSGGAWKLHKLYKGLSEPANSRKASDDVWELHISRLKKWTAQKPESITARVGLADAYVSYAWHARGNGFANKVKEESWKPFRDRLAMAETVLKNARRVKAKCPQWYLVMQIVAKGQSWEWEPYNKVFEEGVALEPAYHYLYGEKAQYLLPRWHGEEGDWERFAEETSQRLGGKLGSIMYYVIATDLACYYPDREFFTDTRVSWPKVKQGFADFEQTYGMSLGHLNEFCRIAGQSGEKAYTRALLARIGDNWDPEVWENREYFEHYKAWAASGD